MIVLKILFAFLAVGVLGGLLGLGLAFASRIFSVKKDERIAALEAALPGLNCGACGFAGCASYAQAVLEGKAEYNLCSPGGTTALRQLAQIMGVSVEAGAEKEKQVAQVHCRGNREHSEYAFQYEGIHDCNGLFMLYGGDKVCKFSCLQLGSCIKVCPVDAIGYDDEGCVWVDKDVCISCGKCIDVCPTGVMKWTPYSADYIIACSNTDKGAAVRKYCKVGCIACKICEKKSPEGGYVVENNLSRIDYSAKGSRSEAAFACPTKCIIPATAEHRRPEVPKKPKAEQEAVPGRERHE